MELLKNKKFIFMEAVLLVSLLFLPDKLESVIAAIIVLCVQFLFYKQFGFEKQDIAWYKRRWFISLVVVFLSWNIFALTDSLWIYRILLAFTLAGIINILHDITLITNRLFWKLTSPVFGVAAIWLLILSIPILEDCFQFGCGLGFLELILYIPGILVFSFLAIVGCRKLLK